MAIPGSKPKLDVHAKVRIGETRTSQRGKSYPAATDYFLSSSGAFAELVGEKPKSLLIRLVQDDVDDAFSSGLEWWAKDKNQKSYLACYTKGQQIGGQTAALRKDQMLNPDDVVLGDARGEGRLPILCRDRSCPVMQKGACKPMARLVFVLDGDPLTRVWELDTKAWSSIEAITGKLQLARTRGSLNGRLFELSVRFESKGTDRFPVLSIEEVSDVPVAVNDDKGVTEAEAVVALANSAKDRASLAAYLDATRAGWRVNQKFVDRIKEVGVEAAIEKILRDAA